MSDDWESETPKPVAKPSDRWEGEDEDDVKDNWDDDDEEDKPNLAPVVIPQPKKKKNFLQIVADNEERKRKEAEARKAELESKHSSPEAKNLEKIRGEKKQQEADLLVALETCGVSTANSIDSLAPVVKEDYDNLRKMLVAKLTPNEKSAIYVAFLEELLRDLTTNLEIEDVRKLSTTVSTVMNEKVKLSKISKTKKKNKGTSLKVERDGMEAYDDYAACEYDDFM